MLAVAMLVPISIRAQSPAPACAVPNQPARTINAVPAQTPPIAAAQKIYGEVIVVIELDNQSKVISATIQRSPSALLNHAALDAAEESTFQTTIVNCVPVAGRFAFVVFFQDPALQRPPAIGAYFAGTWACASSDGASVIRRVAVLGGTVFSQLFPSAASGALPVERDDFTQDGNDLVLREYESEELRFVANADPVDGDRLVFRGSFVTLPGNSPPVAVRVTFEETGHDHYVRTLEQGPLSASLAVQNIERCTRQNP